MATLSLAQY